MYLTMKPGYPPLMNRTHLARLLFKCGFAGYNACAYFYQLNNLVDNIVNSLLVLVYCFGLEMGFHYKSFKLILINFV